MSSGIEEDPQPAVWWVELIRTWLPAILAVLLIRTFVFEPFRIPSGSMVPTLEIGDHVVVNKSSYGLWVPYTGVEVPFMELAWVVPRVELLDWGDPERGDVVVFRFPQNESMNYIKRVVAIPGDKIKVRNNQITLNGEVQERTFTKPVSFVNARCDPSPSKHYLESFDGVQHDVLTRAGSPGRLANFPKGSGEFTVPAESVFVMGDNRDNSEDSRAWGIVRFDQIKGKAHFVAFSWDGCNRSVRTERFFRGLYQIASMEDEIKP